jgi:hypothetical protein
MTNPYRAMCAELVDSVELLLEMRAVDAKPMAITEDRVSRARALLAQPVAEVPTDEELDAFIYGFFFEDDWYYNTEMERGLARAALARYGGSTSNPTEA